MDAHVNYDVIGALGQDSETTNCSSELNKTVPTSLNVKKNKGEKENYIYTVCVIPDIQIPL